MEFEVSWACRINWKLQREAFEVLRDCCEGLFYIVLDDSRRNDQEVKIGDEKRAM